jgi:hypothetical protein
MLDRAESFVNFYSNFTLKDLNSHAERYKKYISKQDEELISIVFNYDDEQIKNIKTNYFIAYETLAAISFCINTNQYKPDYIAEYHLKVKNKEYTSELAKQYEDLHNLQVESRIKAEKILGQHLAGVTI